MNGTITAEQARAALKQYGSERKAAAALGTTRHMVKRIAEGHSVVVKQEQSVKKFGRSLNDFRATYDKSYIVPKKIREALKRLGTGGWAYEIEFVKEAGVTLGDLGGFREQFAEYIVPLRDSRRAWAGSPSTAKQLREML